MTDPFAVTTSKQRQVVLGALLAYAVLFVYELSTGNALAGAAADLVLAALVIPASAVVIRRATDGPETDKIAVATALAFLAAGVSIGYEGLTELELAPRLPTVEVVGTLSLLVALVLYLYRSRST